MIDPVSFMLGMMTHDFLTRAIKKSQLTAVVIALLVGLLLVNILIQLGAFDYLIVWWQAIRNG